MLGLDESAELRTTNAALPDVLSLDVNPNTLNSSIQAIINHAFGIMLLKKHDEAD